jgi:CheY-like chemotaxis protein
MNVAVRALIADGSASVRNVIRQQLECIGCQVVAETENCWQALPLFSTVQPEVVAMDIALPHQLDFTPLELFRGIRTHAPDTSIIVLCKTVQCNMEEVFVREGALGFVIEPFDAASFAHLWRKLSGAYPQLRQGPLGSRLASIPSLRQERSETSRIPRSAA